MLAAIDGAGRLREMLRSLHSEASGVIIETGHVFPLPPSYENRFGS